MGNRYFDMKCLLLFALCATCSWTAEADDDYSRIVYTAVAFTYWCTYKTVPRSIEDFAKVTDTKHRDPRITLDVNEWFKSVIFRVEGDKLKIITAVKEQANGRVQTKHTSTATSNCDSFDPPLSGESQAQTPESLPAIFDPLSWEMNPKEVHQLFPEARVIESAHTIQERSGKFQKTKVITVSPLMWRHLGETYASIYHDDKTVKLIQIETTESRPECDILKAKSPPKWCRQNYNKELLGILELAKKDIADAYGPPTKYNASTRYVRDPREIGYVWKRKGFDLHLGLSQDEQGVWAITLTANGT